MFGFYLINENRKNNLLFNSSFISRNKYVYKIIKLYLYYSESYKSQFLVFLVVLGVQVIGVFRLGVMDGRCCISAVI